MKKNKNKSLIKRLIQWQGARTNGEACEHLGYSDRGYRNLKTGIFPIPKIIDLYLSASEEIKQLRATIKRITGLDENV